MASCFIIGTLPYPACRNPFFSYGFEKKHYLCNLDWLYIDRIHPATIHQISMKHIILIITILFILTSLMQAQSGIAVKMIVSDHQACLGDAIRFDDATTPNDNVTSRRWTFSDTTIQGLFAGDQITVIRQFSKDINPVELRLIRTTFDTVQQDTIFGTHADTLTAVGGGDSIVMVADTTIVPGSTKAVIPRYDTSYAYDTVYIFIHPKMHPTGDSVICAGNETNIKMEPIMNAVTYSWFDKYYDNGSPLAYGSRLQVDVPAGVAKATYYLKITNSRGCTGWDSVNVFVMQPTLTTLPADGNICIGDPAFLMAGKADHYQWESLPPDSSLIGQELNSTIEVSPKTTTLYALTSYGSNGCSAEKIYATITVHPLPTPAVSVTPAVVDPTDPTITLTDVSQNGVSSFWSFGLNNFASGKTVTHTFTELNKDSVTVILQTSNDLGCSADTLFRIAVQSVAIWVPNTFTPNRADNSVFRISTVNELDYFTMQIFNRRGLLVFESNDPLFIWDGSHEGEYCPQGVYVYICNYRLAGTDQVDQAKGSITLLR